MISSEVPGSCLPNWLQGKPSTVKPFLAYFEWTACNCLYCGVRPHLLATLTISITLPLWAPRLVFLPSMSFNGMSRVDFSAQTIPVKPMERNKVETSFIRNKNSRSI